MIVYDKNEKKFHMWDGTYDRFSNEKPLTVEDIIKIEKAKIQREYENKLNAVEDNVRSTCDRLVAGEKPYFQWTRTYEDCLNQVEEQEFMKMARNIHHSAQFADVIMHAVPNVHVETVDDVYPTIKVRNTPDSLKEDFELTLMLDDDEDEYLIYTNLELMRVGLLPKTLRQTIIALREMTTHKNYPESNIKNDNDLQNHLNGLFPNLALEWYVNECLDVKAPYEVRLQLMNLIVLRDSENDDVFYMPTESDDMYRIPYTIDEVEEFVKTKIKSKKVKGSGYE